MTDTLLHRIFALFAVAMLCGPAVADEEQAAELLRRADVARHSGDYLQAVQDSVRAAELSDAAETAREATGLAYDYGFYEQGARAAKRWLDLEPESNEALAMLAQLRLRLGDVRSARRHFERLLERGEQAPDMQLLNLTSFISDVDEHDAHELMQALAKPYEDSAAALYATAVVGLQADDHEYALEKAQQAIEIEPDWIKPRLLYGRALMMSGAVDEAIDYTARLVGDDPDPDPDARMELALLYLTAGREDDALSQVNQVLLERSARTDALRMMAIINYRQNNFDAAWADFEDLLASGDYTADALFYLARIADYRGEYDRAIRLYSEVKGGSNTVPSQRRAAALMAYEKDDLGGALDMIDRFGRERPNYAIDMLLVKAGLLMSVDQRDEALELMNQAIAYRPDDEGIALSRAELMLQMGRVDDAVQAYRAAARRWPDSAMSLNAYGYTLADRTDQYREAEKMIRKALKLDPGSAAIIDSMGWVLYKRGKHEEALGYLQQAYRMYPDHEVAAHVVEVLHALGRGDEALEVLVEAEAAAPESELLEDVRARLFPDSE